MSVTLISSGDYLIETGPVQESSLQEILTKVENAKSKVFILADENSLKYCYPKLVTDVPSLSKAEILEIESGEDNKIMEICLRIWQVLSELQADRDSIMLNLGGGVITDLGGFIAGLYKRGIRFYNIPTTLLAMVDASVGGKTGIDLNNLKNQIGVFNPPDGVFIDPDFLKTLSKRQMMAGLAEMIKHALIADRSYWTDIRKCDFSDHASWEKLIIPSVQIKNHIVASDPKEKGMRKILNFGHTIGHAIESYSMETAFGSLLHGEAVAAGIICEAWLSHRFENLSKPELNEITDFITQNYSFYPMDELSHHRILELMKNDKKNKNNQINFTLLSTIGEATFDNFIAPSEIKNALKYYTAAYGK